MVVTQPQINALLATMKKTLEQIATLRDRVTQLAQEMAEELNKAQQEYDNRLRSLNAEARQWMSRKATTQMRLEQLQATQRMTEASVIEEPDVPGVTHPEPKLPNALEVPKAPEPPLVDPRVTRKRALADHIYYFLGEDQEVVMQHINALLVDEDADIGHMLELLAWGEIWKARPEWESLKDHHERLKGWQPMLEARLAHWKGEVQRLESESRYALWKIKSQGEAQWQAYLGDLVAKQQAENERLAHEVAILEAELQNLVSRSGEE